MPWRSIIGGESSYLTKDSVIRTEDSVEYDLKTSITNQQQIQFGVHMSF